MIWIPKVSSWQAAMECQLLLQNQYPQEDITNPQAHEPLTLPRSSDRGSSARTLSGAHDDTSQASGISVSHHVVPSQIHVDNADEVLVVSNANVHVETSLRRMRLWWPEILSLAASVASLVAVSAVILSFDGDPLEHWRMPWNIRPNTIVSLLMTLCRLAMLFSVSECLGQLKWVYFEQRAQRLIDLQIFDEATRGPWGSILLLCTIRFRAVVASLGAFIILLGLAIDPFAQQVLSYSLSDVSTANASAVIAHALSYDYRDDDIEFVLQDMNRGNIKMSFFNPGLVATVNVTGFFCPATNCSWPPFDSLGICASCHNATDKVKRSCAYNLSHNETFDVHSLQYNYTTPRNVTLDSNFKVSVNTHGFRDIRPNREDGTRHEIPLFQSRALSYEDSFCRTDLELSYILATMRLAEDYLLDWTAWKTDPIESSPTPEIHDCQFSWCVKTYDRSVVSRGLLSEAVRSQKLHLPYLPFNDNGKLGCASRANLCNNITTLPWRDPSNVLKPSIPTVALYRPEFVPQKAKCPTAEEIRENSNVFGLSLNDAYSGTYDTIEGYFDKDIEDEEDTEKWSRVQRNFDNIPDKAQDLSWALTNLVRQGPNTTSWPGNIQATITVIQVHWVWLIYPAALVTLSVLFVSLTIAFSTERHGTVWKTSLLPSLLSAGYFDDLGTSGNQLRDMEHVARNVKAVLTESSEGRLQLVRA